MNKLTSIIKSLSYEEIKALERDLNEGNIEKLIKDRLLQFEKGKRICPVCYKTIEEGDEHYTLTFGPKDFKKKATFCGVDCLEFFISKVKGLGGMNDK